ncbi:MAG: hypothetical protein CMD28_01025 [Flavobacteriales bacterium]|nr:hypothetical protein [Flavobacteriales bacterium]
MKRLTLIMLVAMIPFFTIAQKRSKKGKDKSIQKTESVYEFMVITGYDLMNVAAGDIRSADDMRDAAPSRAKVMFDFGGIRTADVEKLSSQQFKSMAHAVNQSARFGWEFTDANVVDMDEVRVHYYYMRRKK